MRDLLMGLTFTLGSLLVPMTITHGFFWFEAAKNGDITHLRDVSHGRLWKLLARGVFSSFRGIFLVALFYPLRFWHGLRRVTPDRTCPLPPVVLIHGLYHNASAWVLYRRWLKRAGFANVFVMEYSSWNISFEELVQKVNDFVSDVSAKFQGRGVFLVGHSLGGLLCRACLGSPVGVRHVAAVVTLGAPHQGSKLAILGIGRLARSLSYRGRLIRQLEQELQPSTVPCLAIYSPLDNMVFPSQALRVSASNWRHMEVPPVGHVEMVFHRRTAMRVLEYLEQVASASAACEGESLPQQVPVPTLF